MYQFFYLLTFSRPISSVLDSFNNYVTIMYYDFYSFFLLSFIWIEKFSASLTPSQLVKDIDFTNNVCPACQKAFNRKAHVHRHYVELHMRHAEWACSKCSKKFKRRYQMEQHAKSCRRQGGRKDEHPCFSCMTFYPDKAKLIDHMETAHGLCLFNWYFVNVHTPNN